MYITSNLASIPTKANFSNKFTGVTDKGSFRNEKHTGCGNVLFQIASILGICWDNDYIATFPIIKEFYEVLKHKGFNNDNIYRNINTVDIKINNKINISQGYQINKILPYLKSKTNLKITSYFNCWKYFHKYRNRILDIFSIDEKSMKYIKNKYNIFNNESINVSIHIRRGDFAFIANKWNKEYLLNDDYYYKSLEYLDKIIDKNYNLLIFSDDIEYCKKNLNFNNNIRKVIFIENNLDYIDLWLMSLCNHNILNKSTFSWWGSYLNKHEDKIVIAPKINIFHEKKKQYREAWIKTFYFDDWIII